MSIFTLPTMAVGAAPEQRFRLLHFADQAHAALIESRTVMGRRDAARGAMKQPRADARFKLLKSPPTRTTAAIPACRRPV
jgi:hypothetical protein